MATSALTNNARALKLDGSGPDTAHELRHWIEHGPQNQRTRGYFTSPQLEPNHLEVHVPSTFMV